LGRKLVEVRKIPLKNNHSLERNGQSHSRGGREGLGLRTGDKFFYVKRTLVGFGEMNARENTPTWLSILRRREIYKENKRKKSLPVHKHRNENIVKPQRRLKSTLEKRCLRKN